MSPIRTGIVDDESLAREGLHLLLQGESDFEVVGSWSSGRDAVRGIRETRPGLVLLDIQMPEMDGFDVLDALADEPLPLVVFVTAHDTFAIQAFERNALDYLLKPVDEDRFAHTLNRARSRLAEKDGAQTQKGVRQLLLERAGESRFVKRIEARAGGRTVLLAASEVLWIEAKGNYVVLHAKDRSALHRATITELHAQLGPDFVRIHRSTLLRLSELRELREGSSLAVLSDGTTLRVGRSCRAALQDLLNEGRRTD